MARKWMKNPSYGTVVLPSGKVLRENEVIEGDLWAKNAAVLGLVEVRTVDAPPAPVKKLLTDSQAGSSVKLMTEEQPKTESKEPSPPPPSAPRADKPSTVSGGTTSESIGGARGGSKKSK